MIFPAFSGTPKVHCRVNKSPPLVLIRRQMNPVNIRKSYFIKTRLILSSPLPLGLPNGIILSLVFSFCSFVFTSAKFITHFIPLDAVKVILSGDEHQFPQPLVTSFLLMSKYYFQQTTSKTSHKIGSSLREDPTFHKVLKSSSVLLLLGKAPWKRPKWTVLSLAEGIQIVIPIKQWNISHLYACVSPS